MELIVVIVIMGILVAVASSRYLDITSNANKAVSEGVAGTAAAAFQLNYSGCSLTGNVATAGKCLTMNRCADVVALLTQPVPIGLVVTPATTELGAVNGTTRECVATIKGQSTNFNGISAGNP